jgi:hypothetical protein
LLPAAVTEVVGRRRCDGLAADRWDRNTDELDTDPPNINRPAAHDPDVDQSGEL